MHNVTLQFNLSPGDIAYAQITVPALIAAHSQNVDETLAIVDCCPPQDGKYVRSERKLSNDEFHQRVKQICTIVEALKAQGYLDRIIYLHPGNSLQSILSQKYLGGWVHETHDYLGCGLMSYLAAFEVTQTRYLLHYDGDMLLYQAPGYNWLLEAKRLIAKYPNVVTVCPRISPPYLHEDTTLSDSPSLKKELHQAHPLKRVEEGWQDDWFSDRCYLIDREKLSDYLPLLRGWFLIKTLIAKYLRRGYPRTSESTLCSGVGSAGGRRLILASEQSWLLHPASKPDRLIELLPSIQQCIQQGQVPVEQKGLVDIHLSAWENYLSRETSRIGSV
jgi:hypothetical protein